MKDLSRRFKNDFREGEAQGFVGPAVALALLLARRKLKGSCAPPLGGLCPLYLHKRALKCVAAYCPWEQWHLQVAWVLDLHAPS